MQKKYRFHQVIGEHNPDSSHGIQVATLSPIVLAETNSFRKAEKLRSNFPGTVAIVYNQAQPDGRDDAKSIGND